MSVCLIAAVGSGHRSITKSPPLSGVERVRVRGGGGSERERDREKEYERTSFEAFVHAVVEIGHGTLLLDTHFS